VPRVVSVRLRHRGQFYDFDAQDLELAPGDWIIVDTARGQDVGQVVTPPREVADEDLADELKAVERRATESDLRRMARVREREAEALAQARAIVAEKGLDMRLVAAEYTYTGRSLTIYFSSEQRVDFRQLVKELAREFRARIDLRQIGARDEARLLGGYGICGRPLCCATFLGDFLRISVRMAKEQDLPLSPMKISGVCGRLLCCLSYECDQYREIKAELPEVGQEVVTLRGKGRVTAVNVPRETVSVEIREGLTVEVGLEELERAAYLETEGRLPAAAPVDYRGVLKVSEPEEMAEGTPPLGDEGTEKGGRRRRRRRRKSPGAAGAPATETPQAVQRPTRPRPTDAEGQAESRTGASASPSTETPPVVAVPAQGSRRRRSPRRRPARASSSTEGRP